ncbi:MULTISPECIES: hypothetical protein [unclassified Sphingobacterium]|uniref:hypothetical protein n=1 Tax=unclassified Sphingobacterium TaxID=2609468 RepID=UPI0025D51503|nr:MULTISPECIES: hypothetical protein [unclassified Sphingobacterium]
MLQKTNRTKPTLFLSYNSFYVFAPQIATVSKPVISLCQRTLTKKVSATKRTFVFLVYSATPSGQTMAESAAARSGKATVIYWGNLPMPQTTLYAHYRNSHDFSVEGTVHIYKSLIKN